MIVRAMYARGPSRVLDILEIPVKKELILVNQSFSFMSPSENLLS